MFSGNKMCVVQEGIERSDLWISWRGRLWIRPISVAEGDTCSVAGLRGVRVGSGHDDVHDNIHTYLNGGPHSHHSWSGHRVENTESFF